MAERMSIEDIPGYDPDVPIPPEVLATIQPLIDAHNASVDREEHATSNPVVKPAHRARKAAADD